MLDKQKVVSKMREIVDCIDPYDGGTLDQTTERRIESINRRNLITRSLFLDLFADICNTKLYDFNLEDSK